MNILAIETTSAACSAAVLTERGAFERLEPIARGHAERLMPLIGQALDEARCRYADLDLIAVATGPGAFTGIRVGLAAARGIALAAGLPCLGITSFEAVIEEAREGADDVLARNQSVLVVLDSRRVELFAQAFAPPEGSPQTAFVAAPNDMPRHVAGVVGLIAGVGLEAVQAAYLRHSRNSAPSIVELRPTAGAVARAAVRKWRSGQRPVGFPDPIYLRAPDIG